ncbi:probable pectate lyase 8 [Salvia miltiorrhiza]|uniref:probable pectate lyase 8 n=1 Tax=Salvia miltiorrhiza TaxID=226208 RepID=UPI0025AC4522|nr:probable pectate lyase 8 [Salvia miltiorrhiza]
MAKIFALSIFLTALLLANATRSENGSEPKHENNAVDDPEAVAAMVHMSIQNRSESRKLESVTCGTGNPIDDCWRCDPNWIRNRRRLADCAIGFGRSSVGGRDGRYYVVTDPSDEDAVNPRPGTLRHAVIQDRPLWIVFKRDMVITLKQELLVNSFKTIDGRGANVHIANGACITIQHVTNVIVHGLSIHDCKPTGNALVRSSPSHSGWRGMADGDGISIFASSHVWIDHNSLASCSDGLIDAIMGSTAITISNNYFSHHNEVMLLGHSDDYEGDKVMQVTVAYNHFGEGLTQRMPRCRHGYFHVVNNDYTSWEMYAIGGSANPTINSQGNRFLASNNPFAKEVTKRVVNTTDGESWRKWNWKSEGDRLLNGAYFTASGQGTASSYARASSLAAKPSSLVATLTSDAGVLHCRKAVRC